MRKKFSTSEYLRLCLGGAIAGAAMYGIAAPLFGNYSLDAKSLSAVIGAGAVAVSIKFVRWS